MVPVGARRQCPQPRVDVGTDDHRVPGRQQRPVGERGHRGPHGPHLPAIALLGKQFRCQFGQANGVRAGDGARGVRLSQRRLDEDVGDGVGGDRLNQPVLDDHLVTVAAHRIAVGGAFIPLGGLHDRGRHRAVEHDVLRRPFAFVVGDAVEFRVVDARDRRHHQAVHLLDGTGAHDVVRGGGQRLADVGRLGRHRIGHVDRDVHPWSASHRSNPLNTSTPCSREISTTATSRDLSRATTRDPAVPVAPITAMVVTAFTPFAPPAGTTTR